MKKLSFTVFMILMFFCGCNTAEEGQNARIVTPTPTEAPIPEIKAALALAALETVDITELDCFVDEETALKNSNLLNAGYLTYDAAGNIYYRDRNQGGIYVSGPKGENKRCLTESSGIWLQIVGEWLYYSVDAGLYGPNSGIYRIHTVTGETEPIYELPYGASILDGKGIYVTIEEGLCTIDPESGKKEVVQDMKDIGLTSFSAGKDFWIGNVISEGTTKEDVEFFFEGHLVKYDGEALVRLKQQGNYPLLAGKYLSAFVNGSRHVLNMETGEDIDLEVYAQRAVSDGQYLYYVEDYFTEEFEEKSMIYRWDGTTVEELLLVDDRLLEYLFLTPEALYCMPRAKVNDTYVYQLWYYDLETGEIGQVY